MATPTDAQHSYDAIGNFEDLSDMIDNVDPTATPLISNVPKGNATSTKHEWLTGSLAAASGTNWVIEGEDATNDARTQNVRVFNYMGISDKVVQVSGTQEAMSSAGRASDMAHEAEKDMKELKRDVETAAFANAAYAAGSTSVSRKAAGLQAYIKTNTDIASDATASAGNGSDAHTDGTARALTETMVEDVLGTAWDNGGEPTTGYLGKNQKKKFARFSGNTTRTERGEDKRLTNSVDFYIDPLGSEISLVPARHCPADVIHFIDPEHVSFVTLRDFRMYDLAKNGDSERKQILVEGGIKVSNEKAHAAIYDLT